MDGTNWFEAAIQGDDAFIANNLNKFKCLQNERGDTALMLAVAAFHNHLIPLLLPSEQGKKNEHGQTALIIAAIAGNVEAVRQLAFWESGNATSTGKTALSIACNRGFPDVVEILFPYEACAKYKGAFPENEARQKLQEGEQFGKCLEIAQRYRQNELWPVLEVQMRRADQLEFELYNIKNDVERIKFGGATGAASGSKRQFGSSELQQMQQQIATLNEEFGEVQKALQSIKNKPKPANTLAQRVQATEERVEEAVGTVNVIIQDIHDFHKALGMIERVIQQLSAELLKGSIQE